MTYMEIEFTTYTLLKDLGMRLHGGVARLSLITCKGAP